MTDYVDAELGMGSSSLGMTVAVGTRAAAGAAQTDLVYRLRGGDPSALGEVYELHHEVVRAFARRLLGDESAAADLVHDTFVAFSVAVRRYRGEASLRTFLMSVAVRHARRHVRAAARRRAALTRLATEPTVGPTLPDADAARSELAGQLLKALDTLPAKQRVAFVLCEVEGYSSAEAATIAGTSDATVRTRLRLARSKLQIVLRKRGVT